MDLGGGANWGKRREEELEGRKRVGQRSEIEETFGGGENRGEVRVRVPILKCEERVKIYQQDYALCLGEVNWPRHCNSRRLIGTEYDFPDPNY